MGDRFRLIYLKSTDFEKSEGDEPPSSHNKEGFSKTGFSSEEYRLRETFSSQAILKQVHADLEHPDPKVRILAIRYLEKADPSIALPLLQKISTDQDSDVRAQALSSLAKFRDPIVLPLIKKYLRDSDPRIRVAALRGIFKNGEKIDLSLLLQFLSDESSWVRRKVATLLGWTQMEGVFPILIELSKDQDSRVKKAALFSLVTLYPEESENPLMKAMSDSDPGIRNWAKNTLERMEARPIKERKTGLSKRS